MVAKAVGWDSDFQQRVRTELHAAGRYLVDAFQSFDRQRVEYKGTHDLVSYVDRETEAMLTKALAKIAPEFAMWGEEQGDQRRGGGDYWILDPLDGTTNFIHGLPHFAISLAMVKGGNIVAGLILEPLSGELFEAWQGEAARMNGETLKVSSKESLNQSLIATGFPVKNTEDAEHIAEWVPKLMRNTRGLRRYGSAAIDLAWTAKGIYEGFYEIGLSPWDVAAGAYIVEMAGGRVSGIQSDKDWLYEGQILATNGKIHEPLRHLLDW